MDYRRDITTNKRKRKKKNRGSIFLLLIMTIFSFSICIYLLFSYNEQKNKAFEAMAEIDVLEKTNNELKEEIEKDLFTQEQVDHFVMESKNEMLDELKNMVEDGDGMLDLLQHFYPDYVIASSGEGYQFFPISETLEKNNFNLERFTYPVYNDVDKKWEGTANYMKGTEKEAKKGVDVSTFQGNIDWKRVKKAGMEFAIIRLGFRGYETGKIVLDSKYLDNIEGSITAGLDTGVYFFTEALNEREAIEEADFVIENIKDYKIKMPVVIDVEESANTQKTRTKNLTSDQRTKNVIAFCDRIKEAGYDVMIYGNLKSFMIMMNYEELENYDKWFAYYRYPFHFPYKIKMWQYTSSEKIDGIEGKADVNLMFY